MPGTMYGVRLPTQGRHRQRLIHYILNERGVSDARRGVTQFTRTATRSRGSPSTGVAEGRRLGCCARCGPGVLPGHRDLKATLKPMPVESSTVNAFTCRAIERMDVATIAWNACETVARTIVAHDLLIPCTCDGLARSETADSHATRASRRTPIPRRPAPGIVAAMKISDITCTPLAIGKGLLRIAAGAGPWRAGPRFRAATTRCSRRTWTA